MDVKSGFGAMLFILGQRQKIHTENIAHLVDPNQNRAFFLKKLMPSEMKAPAIVHLVPFEALFKSQGPFACESLLCICSTFLSATPRVSIFVDVDKSAPKIVVSEPTQ